MQFLSSSVLYVLVDSKEEHEEEENPGAAKEVPDVVPEKQCQLGVVTYFQGTSDLEIQVWSFTETYFNKKLTLTET